MTRGFRLDASPLLRTVLLFPTVAFDLPFPFLPTKERSLSSSSSSLATSSMTKSSSSSLSKGKSSLSSEACRVTRFLREVVVCDDWVGSSSSTGTEKLARVSCRLFALIWPSKRTYGILEKGLINECTKQLNPTLLHPSSPRSKQEIQLIGCSWKLKHWLCQGMM